MLEDSQITRLMDIANAGCHKGMVVQARTIFNSVLELRPGHVPARIGMAMSHIVVSEFDKAEEILRAVIDESGDADASAALGLCLTLADRKDEAREVLDPLAEGEGSAAALAASLLEQMD